MVKVEIYTKSHCPFCHYAKQLLDKKSIAYTEVDVSNPNEQAKMAKRADGRSTVPQIFIDGEGIGGCDDLYALESEKKLDPLLAA